MTTLISAALMSGVPHAETDGKVPLDRIRIRDGFQVGLYAGEVRNARSLTLSPSGVVYVGTRRAGNVYALVDADGDQKADKVHLLAEGLNMPNGVAYRNGSLFVAEVNRILRYDDIDQHLENPPEPVVVTDNYPSDRHHGWKFIAFGPDGKLYVPVGAPCNICERLDDPRYASITRINPDGSGLEIVAHGVRNSVGFDWHPVTGELWFTDNGRDMIGDEVPPDELGRVRYAGQHFGYPYCHGGFLPDPEFGEKRPCSDFEPPAMNLGPHVAAVGARFYTGEMFPPEFRNQLFVAEHGSWNRSVPIGYRLMVIRIIENSRAVNYEVFADGWLEGGEAWGRPVDVLQMPDGALLLSDDKLGVIYRISYSAGDE